MFNVACLCYLVSCKMKFCERWEKERREGERGNEKQREECKLKKEVKQASLCNQWQGSRDLPSDFKTTQGHSVLQSLGVRKPLDLEPVIAPQKDQHHRSHATWLWVLRRLWPCHGIYENQLIIAMLVHSYDALFFFQTELQILYVKFHDKLYCFR